MNIRRLPNRPLTLQKLRARIIPVIGIAPLKARQAVFSTHTRNLVLGTNPMTLRYVVPLLEEISSACVFGAAGPNVEEAGKGA